ncbi:MAG: DUF2339 domain-containing protein, partial [Microvirga sp.]
MDALELLLILAIGVLPLGMLVGVIVALTLGVSARNGLVVLQGRLNAMEGELRLLKAQATQAAPPPPEQTTQAAEAAPVAETPAMQIEEPRANAPVPAIPATPAQPTPPRQGFEEKLGSRWAVWVGGVALALGGIFLVRYSIEQNLLQPETRTALGGLFALALIGAGEWLRRRE